MYKQVATLGFFFPSVNQKKNKDILKARFAFIAQYVILKQKLLGVPLSLIGKIFYHQIRDLDLKLHLSQKPIFFFFQDTPKTKLCLVLMIKKKKNQ